MKPHSFCLLARLSVSAALIVSMTSCSSLNGKSKSPLTRSAMNHPNLSLHPGSVSSNRLISATELKGAKIVRGRKMHISAVKTLHAAAGTAMMMPIWTLAIIGAGYGGDPTDWLSLPAIDIYTPESPTQQTLLRDGKSQIRISGMDVHYLPSKAGKGVDLARAVGQARVDVTDAFGSYYCRADEIHFRRSTNEIILSGHVTVSASYAPGVEDFGLTRIDLARCTLEYTAKDGQQSPWSSQEGDKVAALQCEASRP
jgi:hypothetical protein